MRGLVQILRSKPAAWQPVRCLGAWGILVATCLIGPRLSAQPAQRDPAAAESLFDEARKLMNGGRYAEACPKLEESQRLDPGVGTLMYLGLCYEQVGKTASSWSVYRTAESAASNAGQLERAKIARERATALEVRLSRLVIRVTPGNPENMQVTRDSVTLGQATWGAAVPVDPGKHTIIASAPGKSSWSTTIEISPGTPETSVEIPRLQDAPAAGAAPGSVAGSQVAAPSGSSNTSGAPRGSQAALDQGSAQPSAPGRTQRWIGVGVGAAGIVGIAVGAGFAAKSSSKSSDAENSRISGTNFYRDPGYELNQQALDAKKVATYSVIFGGAALAGGVVLYLTAPKANSNSARLVVQPSLGHRDAALSLHGAW